VYEVSDPSLGQFPADSLLLSGDCIVNESMLTGESVPVSKIPATDMTLRRMDLAASTMLADVAKSFLFCGTKIVRARRPQDGQDGEAVALAMVVRTGFNTTKGALVRSMLFPKPSGFKFYRDSFRYIAVMGCVAALGFTASFVNFIRLELEWHVIVIRALDLITIVVPPALPATLAIGTSFAVGRLKAKQIFCISPQRVNVGGKLNLMCFDKTGTLTEEGLDILGVRVVSRANNRFTDLLTTPDELVPDLSASVGAKDHTDARNAALFTMATCHSLRMVDGEPVGDPLDLKMFEFTAWSFDEGNMGGANADEEEQGNLQPAVARPPAGAKQQENGARQQQSGPNVGGHLLEHSILTANIWQVPLELGITNSFEFVSQLRRASVIVRMFGRPSGDIYVKGAPECMREICRPETCRFPFDCATKHTALTRF
jgi:cation-transporting ATPase 13A3/4/5